MDEPKYNLEVVYISKPEEGKLSSFRYDTKFIDADELIAHVKKRLSISTCDTIQLNITVINNNEQETTI